MHLEPGVLVLESPDQPDDGNADRWRLEIDAPSGRLLRWNYDSHDGDSRISARLRTETGTFARRVQSLASATAGHPNRCDPVHPLRTSAESPPADLPAWSAGPARQSRLQVRGVGASGTASMRGVSVQIRVPSCCAAAAAHDPVPVPSTPTTAAVFARYVAAPPSPYPALAGMQPTTSDPG